MNVDLMLKVANHIEHNPEEYNQGNWCSTQCCIAGHAVMLADASQQLRILATPAYVAPTLLVSGREISIHAYARQLLDISEDLADMLFSPYMYWADEYQPRCWDSPDVRAHKAGALIRYLVAVELQYREDRKAEDLQLQEPIAAIQEEPELILA
jgi:hypothetical protein